DQTYCGASLIAPDVAITAAHCVIGAQKRMRLVANIQNASDLHGATTIAVKAVRIHPDYLKKDAEVMANDLALLILDSYDASTRPNGVAPTPIALNADQGLPESAPNGKATVIGWGNSSSFGDLFEDALREVDVPSVSLPDCRHAYGPMVDSQICAGD